MLSYYEIKTEQESRTLTAAYIFQDAGTARYSPDSLIFIIKPIITAF
jgi:hypothetical protein